jgi:hypothetical protein
MPRSEGFATETSERETDKNPQIAQITQISCESGKRSETTNHFSPLTNHYSPLRTGRGGVI